MLQLVNEITAVIVVPILILSIRGFWPHLLRALRTGDWHSPQSWLVAFLLIVDTKGVVRMVYWDIFRPLRFGTDGSLEGALVNGFLNTFAGVASICGLLALYYAIPQQHEDPALRRDAWSIWSAPFYPNRLRIFSRLK